MIEQVSGRVADIQIRVYEENDYEMIAQWRSGHKHRSPYPMFSKELFPPVGQIAFREIDGEVEDLAVLWLYLPAPGRVCFIEHGISKPGLDLVTVRKAFSALEMTLTMTAKKLGYWLIIMHTIPAIARYATKRGWVISESETVSLFKPCG